MNWSLALLALLMGPGLALVAWRYSRRSNPVLIDVQQRVALVTEMAEESAVGIRVIKASGARGIAPPASAPPPGGRSTAAWTPPTCAPSTSR